jgi:VWFA-related protein
VSFRSGIALVPVDVRVIDAQGRPVVDLKQEDFTIFEQGIRQDIRHFSLQVLTPEPPPPAGAPTVHKAAVPTDAAPGLAAQHSRTFLLVLGRGRLQYPSKALDALLQFVRVQLLPQDRVAVMAYDRATDFTTDHDQIGQLLERLRASHEAIEAAIAQQFRGLAAVYGSKAMPAYLQSDIANVFKGTGSLPSRQVVPAEMADAKGLAAINRRATDGAMDAAIARLAADADATPFLASPDSVAIQMLTDLPFEEFVARNAGTMQDLSKIYTGIAYLRFVEGEKHLAFFTERGLSILRGDDVDRIAEVANDARVVIDNFLTGGVTPTPIGRAMTTSSSLFDSLAAKDLRSLSTLTGGQASINEYTRRGLDRVDLSTRASYLLGYYPAKPLGDGGYRNLVVKVNRPGVTVLYRRGYFARLAPPVFNRQKFLTDSRVVSAALAKGDVRDIVVRVKVTRVPGKGGSADEVIVDATIDIGRIAFKVIDGNHVGTIDIVVFFADARGRVVQENWQKASLQVPVTAFERVTRDGVPYRLQMPVKDSVRLLKVVVYNYEKDTVGSAEAVVK